MFTDFNQEQTYRELDLSGQSFRESEWENCVFEHCKFVDAKIFFCAFVDCEFIACDFSNVQLANSRLNDCTFRQSKLLGVNWSELSDIVGISFQDCALNYSVFSGLDLYLAKFERSKLLEVDFSESKLKKANFSESDLLGSNFNNCDLREADFRDAINYSIDPKYSKIKRAKFSLPEAASLLSGFEIELSS